MADASTPVEAANEAAADAQVASAVNSARAATRKRWLIRLALAVAVLGGLWAVYYFFFDRNQISTDNAYVGAEVAQVTPLISASVVEVAVRDTQMVKRGQVLARLDPANARIAMAQAEADLAEARSRYRQSSATGSALTAQVASRGAGIAQAQAQLATAQADLAKARIDLQRREAMAPSGAVSGQELTDARRAYRAAQAALQLAQAGIAAAQATRTAAQGELAANRALVGGSIESDPGVMAAAARLQAAQLDLDRMTIRAPFDGVVARREVQVGQRVAQGVPIMTIVPLASVYVDANFKEKQLRQVRVGMPAKVTADIYGGSVVYHGRVAGFSGGTGSAFALIPAQNATGNWIKVVQRLPVRIELDPKELAQHPLRVGLSTEVEIDLSNK